MRKKNKSSYGVMFLIAVVIIGAFYVYTSAMFERDMPKITMENNGYWNLKTPLDVSIEDKSGLKSYKVVLKTSGGATTLHSEQFLEIKKSINLKVEPPKSAYAMKDDEIRIVIEANDASKWNFLNGNSTLKEYKLKVDKKRPQLGVIANSYKIKKGGAALVIFQASDENLKEIYIQTNFDKKFKPQPFYKEGYYISLLAWPITQTNFSATIIAKDYANNSAKTSVPLYLKDKKYRVSNIKITDKFLNGKIAQLAEEFMETQGVTDSIEQFKIINEDIREKNENLIHEITSKVSDEMISDFKLNKMYPLKNAAVVAHFGDHRKYTYNSEYISESYHLGLDMASNAMAKIKPQNDGEVVFSDYNGLYGNMPIVHHGLGLYTLYGHCSTLNVNRGDSIIAGTHMANTGKSGYAMGDHLHFGVLIQGIEVRPAEWMDSTWMKLNIGDVIKSAKEIIDRG
ncbi:MAG: M23 family metallopeptidase [Sulfurimonas sp.]|uniref:M23 family metallopeptidase n=1 Tax=Sulfurimonas sp. TaxID=2022749 RepID=UPI00260929BE|nr:M23 family metallopeptidase [Sulfurimonas sp.]MCW8894784.1 M23 family metallopeptidase [Sulfurimonas sp.]MCW8953550.1 M23 family metallopeptidase [Sulfurimonas sp.]MCW9067678.1 M23 family metallopeptidase [Sulfurimonas sp.]